MSLFYTAIHKEDTFYPITGPFDTKELADADVDRAFDLATGVDPWLHFADWGVIETDREPKTFENHLEGKR